MRKAFRVNFSQVFKVDAKELERTSVGFLKLPVRISRIGCMVYKDTEGNEYNEFKPPEELFKKDTMESLQYVTVTDKHPSEMLVRPYNNKRLSVGMVVEKGVKDEGFYLKSNLIITEQEIIDRIIKKFNNGERQEVSAGYEATIVEEDGEFDGVEYKSIQRDIVYNHCALVDLGRAGPECSIQFPKNNEIHLNSTDQSLNFRYSTTLI